MPKKDHTLKERRRYIRLDSVFPVSLRLVSADEQKVFSDWLQGFTNNVSMGGICLAINNLKPELAKLIQDKQVKLSLSIEMPLSKSFTPALANIAWFRGVSGQPNKYLLGLSYERINPGQNKRIMGYARAKQLFVPAALSIIILLAIAFGLNSYLNLKLIRGNKALVEQLVKIVQESSVAKQKIKEINKQRDDLQTKIHALELQLKIVEEEKAALDIKEAHAAQRIDELNILINKLSEEKSISQEELIAVQQKENMITEELLKLNKKKATLEKANLDKMYQWLKIHQNPSTGLVMSFEGDHGLAKQAFIYDQALAAQAYTRFSDYERARKLLDFFAKKAQKVNGMFVNAYYVDDLSPAEFSVHSGPNIWVGIAAVQYTSQTKDKTYLPLAEAIARSIISLQGQDQDGGIRGGPELDWYSTEHNLDAYAFFNMLSQLTQKPEYRQAQDKILDWLAKHTYDKSEVPIKRGKGDATIATDTYAWSIAAVGPEKLIQLNMNPDRILEFAEENCRAEVDFLRPTGQSIKIKGFDFAPQRHLGRGGVVSSEWTAQMVMAFKIMADFYYQKRMIAKARAYEAKADDYLAELSNMIISSPSASGQGESCLPYATQDNVDTGHGWMTPKGKTTGSVAGTAYTLFAYYKYNPLTLKQ